MSLKTALKLTVASAAAATAFSVPAFAQEVDEEARLAPVVTTAQRVEEDAQNVPISITTVADEKLDNLKAGGADIRFLSARVPSVIAESSFGRAFPRFYIRGIGNTDFDLNASQPVSLVYDDVPYENPVLKGYPVFDLEGIEVLRGPQGTLFGRNTPGGIIKFDSVKPGDEANGYVRASYGTYNTKEVEGAFGTRLSDDFAFRVSGIWQDRDPFVDNAFTGETDRYEGFEEYAGRVQLLWSPFADTDVLLNLHARSNDSDARLFRANIIEQGQRGLAPGFDFDTVSFDGDNFLTQDASGLTLRVDREINDALDLTYILGRETAEVSSRGDIDGGFGAGFLGAGNFGPGFIPFPSESSGAVDDLTQTTNELRLAYDNGGKARWQAGVFLFDEDLQITSRSFDTLAPGRPENGRAVRTGQTQAFSFFGSLEYDVTDQLTLAGGARFTDEKKDFVVERQLSPFGAGPLGPITGSVGDEQISWDASATYRQTEDLTYYARIAKGFRGPSIQGRLVFGDTVSDADSETVLSYEAGVKSELLDNRVRVNANVFFYELENQQLTIVGGINNTVALFNADEGQGYGFEADIEAAPMPNLLLTAGVSYNNTEIKDDLLIAPGCGAPCTILDPEVFDGSGNSLGFNISGNSFPNAPEWIGNFTARYAIPFRNGEFFAFTDWAYKGETNFFLYDSIEFGEDGYWQGGLRAGWQGDNGVEASVFARNITDEVVLEGAIDFNNLTGFVNEPRTYGIEVRYDF
ncbi:TonB-dependent receptor [Hyphomonas sp. FCG-A18]|jgi:iron complex outermembrane receptor protein|uniref:TonB-dependent receptor n=1 Tax=Hyphomonas sp. FCG-A18 TaxID=3080019 RepID=UPI002B2FE24E|nr:TonB-dependent receptor [Hyphomonas sp. FCG-A18]